MNQNPNIPIRNIYYMLSYAFTSLRQSVFECVGSEEFENLHNLLAAILQKGIAQQLKRGLYREYENKTENQTTLRGKIDFPGTIQNRLARRPVLTCQFDVLSENNLHNQILKTTALLLMRDARVDAKYRDLLRKEMLFFSEVSPLNPAAIPWKTLHFHRTNQTYQMLLNLCRLILEGLLMTTESGELKLASFFDEQQICRLYEKFILEYFVSEFPEFHPHSSRISWALDDDQQAFLPVMQSDIMLTHHDKILIIDAKYYSHTMQKHFDIYTIHSGNLYQIFTYVKNKAQEYPEFASRQVSGLLLYAHTMDSIQPSNTYHMSGNTIHVRTLNLNQPFEKIATQLNLIADWLTG